MGVLILVAPSKCTKMCLFYGYSSGRFHVDMFKWLLFLCWFPLSQAHVVEPFSVELMGG